MGVGGRTIHTLFRGRERERDDLYRPKGIFVALTSLHFFRLWQNSYSFPTSRFGTNLRDLRLALSLQLWRAQIRLDPPFGSFLFQQTIAEQIFYLYPPDEYLCVVASAISPWVCLEPYQSFFSSAHVYIPQKFLIGFPWSGLGTCLAGGRRRKHP